MKITDIIPDIVGKDLWVAVYHKNVHGVYTGSIYFINFITIRDENNIVFRYVVEGELLRHGRYLDQDSVLFNMEYCSSPGYINNTFEAIEPLEIYTFDDILEMGWEAGEEEE